MQTPGFQELRFKSYGCLKYLGELWAGWAYVGTNQQELTTCARSREKGKKKFQKRGASQSCLCIDPRLVIARWLRVDTWTWLAWFLLFGNFLLEVWEIGHGFWENWCTVHPFFQVSSLHLELSNLPFLIEFGDFTFFEILFLKKFRIDLDLYIYHLDFCFMEN